MPLTRKLTALAALATILSSQGCARARCLLAICDSAEDIRPPAPRETEGRLRLADEAVQAFRAQRGRLPDTLGEVLELPASAALPQPKAHWLQDGWGRPLVYRREVDGYQLRSLGPDGMERTPDDMVLR